MKQKETILQVITECCRVLLGMVFVFSGFVKAVDPVGFAIKIGEYLASFGLDSFTSLSTLAAFNLSAIEFMLGVCLLLGVYRQYASLLTLVFMAFMTPLTLYLALFDPVSDCGCFGDAVVITNWETFTKNLILSAAAVMVFINHKRMYSFYTYKAYWFVALFAYLFSCGFSWWNYIHQPILDFRPYTVGANIPDLMAIPEGAAEDEYKYAFIYEKDGVQKEFDLDNLPTDSAWVFVESTTELLRKGYEPPIAAFNLYTPFGEDITEDILTDTAGVFLLLAPKLENASDDHIDEINDLYDYSIERGLTFYGVTGSSIEEVNNWIDYTGAEYPFLQADEVLLKTVIRSNPGLVLLKGGTILGKWNYRDIPGEPNLDASVADALAGKLVDKSKEVGPLVLMVLTFTVPLLLVWLYDTLRNRRRKDKKEIIT